MGLLGVPVSTVQCPFPRFFVLHFGEVNNYHPHRESSRPRSG